MPVIQHHSNEYVEYMDSFRVKALKPEHGGNLEKFIVLFHISLPGFFVWFIIGFFATSSEGMKCQAVLQTEKWLASLTEYNSCF